MTAIVTVFVPTEMHGTTFTEEAIVNGNKISKTYHQRVHNGWNVLDITFAFWLRLFEGGQGKKWADGNPEMQQWMSKDDRRVMMNNAFPGEHRAAPVPPAAPPPVVMVKVRAPIGVTNFSHDGVNREIAEDGTVTVTDKVAAVLASHGFVVA